MTTRRSRFACTLLVTGFLAACAAQRPPREPPAPVPEAPARTAAAPAPGLPAEVLEATWGWVSLVTPVEELTVHVPERYTVRFLQSGGVELRADCNRGGASWKSPAEGQITIGPIALTRMACPSGSLSERFARDLGRVAVYFVRDGALYLELPADSGTLRFRQL